MPSLFPLLSVFGPGGILTAEGFARDARRRVDLSTVRPKGEAIASRQDAGRVPSGSFLPTAGDLAALAGVVLSRAPGSRR